MTQPQQTEGVRVGFKGERVAFGRGGHCIGAPSTVSTDLGEAAEDIYPPDVVSLLYTQGRFFRVWRCRSANE